MYKRRLLDVKKLIDFWSIPHFLFGTLLALATITFVLSIEYMFLVTLFLAIVWELIEMKWRLCEAPGNGFVDVLLALVGFTVTFLLVNRVGVSPERYGSLLIFTTLLFLCLNFFAWRARFEHDREFQG
ncbi:MAG: hypothetical protein PHH40_00295 [Candidatus Moranbacteria bacterium]|nr:hypothetical protein [Candidatus Moranbacteria bacterium]MDD3965306.1 hypothetical protein [Candidatus Moranbacteria bacterium]